MTNISYIPGSMIYLVESTTMLFCEFDPAGLQEMIDNPVGFGIYAQQFSAEMTTFGYLAGKKAYTFNPETEEFYEDSEAFALSLHVER